jgi:sialate O-acetylesterase
MLQTTSKLPRHCSQPEPARIPRFRLPLRFCLLIPLLFAGLLARAEVTLPTLFTDHMVLQRGQSVPVWGWAEDGEEITVRFRNQEVRTRAQDGKWRVNLRKLTAGGPDTLTVTGRNRIEVRDVLVGEVWICSGQSNMEWAMRITHEPKEAIAQSANPSLRLFTVPKTKANTPAQNVNAAWALASPETVEHFSAVAYYFGRDLQRALNVPVGLIHTSWGGSPAEVWMSESALSSNPRYKSEILDAYPEAIRNYEEALAAWTKEETELAKEGKKPARGKPGPPYWKPSELYNGMIAPLIPYAFQGAIWYQGESNAGRAEQYRSLFPDMIRNWRQDWSQGDFPFLLVQLAPWDKNRKRSLPEITAQPGDSDWAELREAQALTTRLLPKVGMAVITDAGDKDDIHPGRKEPVGARLALQARKIAYREKLVASGPTYKSMKINGGGIILSFSDVGGGLEASEGRLQGFAIAGADQKFVWANATLSGNRVVVSHPDVPNPVAVRYGWADYPVVNLFNKEGLPAAPFRTDNFPLTTAGKK